MHTKAPIAAIFFDEVGAPNDLQKNLDNDFIGAFRLISRRRGVLCNPAALVHLLCQQLYKLDLLAA